MQPDSISLPIFVAVLLLGSAALAEDAGDPLGRDTPRGAMAGFLEAADAGDLQGVAEYIDTRNLPRSAAAYPDTELAAGLRLILERALWVDLNALSDQPGGKPADDLPPYRDEIGRLQTTNGEVALLLQLVPGPEGAQVWKVSNATIARLPELYEEFRYSEYVEWLWERLPGATLLGVELFKWVASLSYGLLAYPFILLVGWWLARALSDPGAELYPALLRFLTLPVPILAFLLIVDWALRDLGMGVTAQRYARAGTINTICIVWVLISGINLARDAYSGFLSKRGRDASVVLLRPVANGVKIIIGMLAILVWLENSGYNITALLTGLGIGGLAVALVLQKPLEDVFGAITLYTQQPIKVGDFGRFGEVIGVVEEISLRSTRIRTLDHSVVAIANSKLANGDIENISARRRIRYSPTLYLSYDTSPEQLQYILLEIRRLLIAHSAVIPDGIRARFARIGAYAFEFDVHAYVETTDFAYFLGVAEDLNFRIADIVRKAGTGFALPAQTQFNETRAVEPDRRANAEAAVASWRRDDVLAVPDLDDAEIASLTGTIEYPPPTPRIS